MRFLAAATLGLLASQARVATALTPYTLGAQLSCSNLADVVHFDYTLNGLAVPPNFPGTDIYSAAFRFVKAGNSTALVGVPVTNVAAKDGMGRSEINFNPIDTAKNVPKDNAGANFIGNTVYQLPGTMLFHQQVNGVSGVTGYFEIDNNVAIANDITCTVTSNSATPNIALIPQQYTINGIPQLVLNSFDTINNHVYQQLVGSSNTQATQPVYNFDVNPAVNIDSCFNDVDANGNPRFRVPFRVKKLAVPANNEQGVISIAVSDANGNPTAGWSVSITEQSGFIGKGFRDIAEPSILNWVQPSGIGEIFGRIDFPVTTPNVTCGNKLTDVLLAIVDYSTIDVGTGVQTWHFIKDAVNNGIDTASQINTGVGQLNVQAAQGQQPQAATAAQQAARKAAAQKACAAKKAAAAKAAQAAAAAAAAAGQDAATPCLLTVPPNPLTANGLATPYVLQSPCTMADTAGFAQATIISPSTGKVFAYQPLVIQQGTKPLIKPVVPTLPQDAVVAIWFGSNANFQKLVAANQNTLTQANCVNGAVINGQLSIFGQVAACNGVNFYNAAAQAVFNGLLTVPALGNAIDGLKCPTLRSFMIVDQDVQDNLQTQYLLDANGNTALNTPANLMTLTAAAAAAKQAPPTKLVNPGDNPLLSRFINPAIGCNNWEIPDLSAPGTTSVTAGIGEVFAAFRQAAPVARCPIGNPMVLDNDGNPNLGKLNAFRTGLAGQNAVQNANQASTASYCKNMVGVNGAQRLLTSVIATALKNAAGPTAGQNLFDFLVARFAAAVGADNLQCGKLVPGLTNPLAGGAVIAAQAAFFNQDALLVGAATGDNQATDPYAELSQNQIAAPTTGTTFPVAIVAGAIGGVVALIIASIVIFKVVQKRKAGNVMATTARECKV